MMTEQAPITGVAAVAFDCADPIGLARFWAELLGSDVEVDADGDATVPLPGGGPHLIFLKVPESKATKNRLHLDLRSRDYARAVEHALRLGAHRADEIYAGDRWQVLRDPEGNEFCILRPLPLDVDRAAAQQSIGTAGDG